MAKYPNADIVASLQAQIELMKNQHEQKMQEMRIQIDMLMEEHQGTHSSKNQSIKVSMLDKKLYIFIIM